MKIEPNYPGEIIVLVKHKMKYSWFVSYKEFWIMDLLKMENAFRRKFGQPEVASFKTHTDDERSGFELLNEDNVEQFLDVIKEYRVGYSELKEFCDLHNEVYPEDQPEKAEPTFFIDFDEKCFHSYFDEPGSYEHYVPNDWNGVLHINRDYSETLMREATGGKK